MGASRFLNNEGIWIARGEVTNTSHINKFGFTGTDVNGTATVYDANGTTALYPYPADDVVSITSSANSGAAVEIQGLDANYNLVTENINIGSTGSVTFSRVFRARMIDTLNTANVVINVGGNLAATILANNGQTLMAVYTVPADKTAYLVKFQGSMDKSNASVKFKLFSRPSGGTFNLKGQWGTQGGNSVNYDYPVPLEFTEKTDIKIDVTTGAAVGCGAIFDLVLVDK